MTTSRTARTVEQDAVVVLYRNMRRSVWLSLAVVAIVLVLLVGHVPAAWLVAWAALAVAVQLVRRWHLSIQMEAATFGREPARDARSAAIMAALGGGTIGLAMALFAPALPEAQQSLVGIVLMAVAAGAVGAMLASRLVYSAYALSLLAMLALGYARVALDTGGSTASMMVLVTLVYAGSVCLLHHWANRALLESFELRRRNEAVLREKEALLIKLELDNAELLADRDAFLLASLTDALTGLANRRHFDKTLIRDFERARREGMWLSCIMVDVDHFKPFNDRHGHAVGDATLKKIAQAISECLNRGADFAARYGGEEFVILLPGTERGGATMLAERIRLRVGALVFAGGERLSVSAGVAALRPGESRAAEAGDLLRLADGALYAAKAAGRNRVMTANNGIRGDSVVSDPA